MPSAAPRLFASSFDASPATSASSSRTGRPPSYAEYILQARCWLGKDVTGGKRQTSPTFDALSLHLNVAGMAGQSSEARHTHCTQRAGIADGTGVAAAHSMLLLFL